MTTILLIEDDENVREPLADLLRKEGWRVVVASNLKEGSLHLKQEIHLLVLDWNLPDGEGLRWLTEKRDKGFLVPVIMLTARTDLVDRVIGLEYGANDYMTKPFESRELVARIRAHLRSHRQASGEDNDLRYGPLQLNTRSREVFFNQTLVHVTPTEFGLLKFLIERPGLVCAREEIMEAVWNSTAESETRALDNCVLQLRKKIDADFIQTVRSVGYKLKAQK